MCRPCVEPSPSLLDSLLGEASWLLSHAEALADYSRDEEAATALARGAQCEELRRKGVRNSLCGVGARPCRHSPIPAEARLPESWSVNP